MYVHTHTHYTKYLKMYSTLPEYTEDSKCTECSRNILIDTQCSQKLLVSVRTTTFVSMLGWQACVEIKTKSPHFPENTQYFWKLTTLSHFFFKKLSNLQDPEINVLLSNLVTRECFLEDKNYSSPPFEKCTKIQFSNRLVSDRRDHSRPWSAVAPSLSKVPYLRPAVLDPRKMVNRMTKHHHWSTNDQHWAMIDDDREGPPLPCHPSPS